MSLVETERKQPSFFIETSLVIFCISDKPGNYLSKKNHMNPQPSERGGSVCQSGVVGTGFPRCLGRLTAKKVIKPGPMPFAECLP
jgi:hypothetical protein